MKIAGKLLTLILLLTGALTMVHAVRTVPADQSVSIHTYFNFYDSSGDDINRTIGLASMEVTGTMVNDFIEAQVNPSPDVFDFQQIDGFPQVLLNYGDVSGRETDLTPECSYDPETGRIRIPIAYAQEYITVKCILSDQSKAYQYMVPDEYKVIKNSIPGISVPDIPRSPASDTSEFEVLQNSSNDVSLAGLNGQYKAGDVISVSGGYIQTLNRREDENLYHLTGTADYMGYKGESIGYAISFDCADAPLFTNIGNPGGQGSGTFPTSNGPVNLAFSARNWMYARCITTDSNYFDGNPRFSGGKIHITNVASDGTLTCWIELYLTGPKGENAQDVGMYFKIHPLALQSLTINKTIYRDEYYPAHGTPTFLFKIQGQDVNGTMHTWHRCISFTKSYILDNTAENGTITKSAVLKDLPRGTYTIHEIPVSRYTLTKVTAQTDNISIDISPKEKSYAGITPVSAAVLADLQYKSGEVTFFNQKITWDKFSHSHGIVNTFPLKILDIS